MKLTLTSIARDAGALMMRHFGRLETDQVEQKTGSKDLVTIADREVEKLVLERLSEAFPDHGFLGEEGGEAVSGKHARFIVDPIDGTVNYAHSLPYFALSIAREEAGEITHGLIYLPFFDEMYYAEKGEGASLNGKPISVSQKTELPECIVATGFACIRGKMKPDGLAPFSKVIYQVRDLRRFGAATIDLAYVARGLFDGFYEIGLSVWDVAAGILIVSEAGGKISGFGGIDDPLAGGRILTSNGLIHDRLLELIEDSISK